MGSLAGECDGLDSWVVLNRTKLPVLFNKRYTTKMAGESQFFCENRSMSGKTLSGFLKVLNGVNKKSLKPFIHLINPFNPCPRPEKCNSCPKRQHMASRQPQVL